MAYLFILEICGRPAVRLVRPAPAAAEERLPPDRTLPARVGLVQLGVLVAAAAVVVVGPLDGARHVDDGVELGRELVGAAPDLDVLGLLRDLVGAQLAAVPLRVGQRQGPRPGLLQRQQPRGRGDGEALGPQLLPAAQLALLVVVLAVLVVVARHLVAEDELAVPGAILEAILDTVG